MLHRDDGIYPSPRPHPEVVLNTMWALDDFTEENGATRRRPRQPPLGRPSARPTPTTTVDGRRCRPGRSLFYVGSLWHGGGANRTDRPRLGVILEYVARWLRPQENHVLAVPRDVVRTLPDAAAGAARLQHLPAVRRLRRRPPPAPGARGEVTLQWLSRSTMTTRPAALRS